MNKHDFFMDNRSAARAAFERPDVASDTYASVLADEDPLLRELRIVFDWMAREKKAERIPSRLWKQRLPDIHRKFPQLASNFKSMDANSDCWLEWEEFAAFCLKDARLAKTLRRAAALSVYGLSKTGERSFKDPNDPAHMCELGPSPPILPWEHSHVIEWRIEGLKPALPGRPMEHAGIQIRPGQSIASPPFRAAGVCGFLRFWPAGYWTESQRTRKCSEVRNVEVPDPRHGGPERCRPPSATSWCCIGACLPSGTNLSLRYFVNEASSQERECYWSEGAHVHQLWGPKSSRPPYQNAIGRNGKCEPITLIVGIEIYKNLSEHKNMRTEHRLKAAADTDRRKRRPLLKDPLTEMPVPEGSQLLMNRSSSSPALLQQRAALFAATTTAGTTSRSPLGATRPSRHQLARSTGGAVGTKSLPRLPSAWAEDLERDELKPVIRVPPWPRPFAACG